MMLPHNIKEYNSKHLFLQQLAYTQGKEATSYDSVNSLTTNNNQYTLLYPNLVQELFGLSLHKSNINTNITHSFSGLADGITKSSSFDASLHPREILFFLQIVSLYQLELSKGNSCITYSSLKLARLLGFDSSSASDDDTSALKASSMRSSILKMTSKLESMGLLKVFRSKRNNGVNKVNKIVPILPDRVYNNIRSSSDNLKVVNNSQLDNDSNLDHILKAKLFVPIELQFMKHLFKCDLPAKHKLFFLNCIMTAYRNFKKGNSFSFSSTSSELMQKNNISKRTLFNIFKYIKHQGNDFFIRVEHKYTQSDDIDSNRYDKSIFVISVDPLVFPNVYINQLNNANKEENTDTYYDELQSFSSTLLPDTDKGIWAGVQKKQPSSAKKTAHNNKEEIINKSINKNIDYIDVKPEEEFLEDKLCLSSSKSYNNSSFFNDFSQKNELKRKEEWRELRHFYPLSERDISLLNSRANREFSNNFVNQLLLKLYIKYPEKRFKNRFTFLSYMMQILQNEKHQGSLVNHTSFRFSCNVGTEEKRILEYERYLNQIEDSLDLSKEMQIKKKIAGRFSTEVAYKILKQVEFKKNHDHSFITALIPNHLDLSERQTEILSQQLEAVYGINGYYVQEVEEDENQPPKSRTTDIDSNRQYVGTLDSGKDLNTIEAEIIENTEAIAEDTVWHQIRKGLREELGAVVDKAWFSKAVAAHCNDTKTLTLTMPTRFMSDWVRNNYSHVIRRLAGSVGAESVEYEY